MGGQVIGRALSGVQAGRVFLLTERRRGSLQSLKQAVSAAEIL